VSDPDLPESVQRFIRQHISSVEAVEVLLLLHGSPDRDWTGQQVSKELYSQPEAAQFRLDDLAGRGLLSREGDAFRYRPTSRDLAAAVDALAETYARRRVRVVSFIFSPPSHAGRSIADAFRFRRDGR
jgi:hypothetical protein